MYKKIIIFLILTQVNSSFMHAIDLKQYIEQIVKARNQLIEAIKGLKDGKQEISKIYSDQLKPQLIDTLDAKINDTNKMVGDLKQALDPLTSIPDFIKSIVSIGDLEPTLRWIIDNPLAKVNEVLTNTKNVFQPIAEQLVLPNAKAQALYSKFDLSTAKLQSAVCKIEKTLTAIKANFTPSPECAPK